MTEKEVFSSENVIPNVIPEGKKSANVPNLRFPNHDIEWWYCLLSNACIINPKTEKLDDEFVYIDLESVIKGVLVNTNIISRENAPSRAQRVLKNDDICFQCVRPYQFNNYYFEKPTIQMQWVASTGYAQLRTTENEPRFLYQLLSTARFNKEVMLRCTGTSYPAINSNDLGEIEIAICSLAEQRKIANFLTLIDERIDTQSKIIEKLQSQMKGICDRLFYDIKGANCTLNDIMIEKNERTIVTNQYPVLSSTVKGLFLQSEYFSKSVASENNCGYKVVHLGNLIISPQNLWLGNITYNEKFEVGIVSPSYKVFEIAPQFDEHYIAYLLKTKRALNSFMCVSEQGASVVRRNLNMDLFGQINFVIPPYEIQKEIGSFLKKLDKKISLEKAYLESLIKQKQYLLRNMFI